MCIRDRAIGVGAVLGLLITVPALNSSDSNPALPVAEQSDTTETATLLKSIREKIHASGLGDKVSVGTRGTVIVARGNLSSKDHQIWQDLRTKFQSSGFDTNRFVNLVGVSSVAKFSSDRIAAVSFAPERFVVGKDGTRARVGEKLSGAWEVVKIENNSVSLKRGSQSLVVPF